MIKKIFFTILTFLLVSPTGVFAQQIGIPKGSKPGKIPFDISLGQIIANILQIMTVIGSLGALVFVVWGSFDWITSGGDKEKVAGARKKISTALIGLVLMGLSLFIVTLVGEVLGIKIFDLGTIPALYENRTP